MLFSLTVFEFILLCLASFRLTRLVVFDTITTFIRKPFHEISEETNENGVVETYLTIKGTGLNYWVGELLSCYWCVAVWASIFLFFSYIFIPYIAGPLIVILAIAAVASIIEAVVSKIV